MPSLGRGDWVGSSFATTQALLRADPAVAVAASWLWGGELTATAEPTYGRVRLDVYWPDVAFVTVTRYDADGTSSPVRNCEPILLCTQTIIYDHEAPLDAECYYRMSPTGDSSVGWNSDPVTLDSDDVCGWLGHPLKPYLNQSIGLTIMGPRELPARRGVARPIGRSDPIVVHQVRLADTGSVALRTDGTWANLQAIRALLADGNILQLRQTGDLGGESLYVSIDTVTLALLEPSLGLDLARDITLPFDVTGRPPGTAAGPVGATYDDVAAANLTYEYVAAGEASYAELAAHPGP